MPPGIGFDNEKYLAEQTSAILERVKLCNNKLYLEFGGKLLFDYHAARVLPGYDPNVKMRLLQNLAGQIDIILCIHAGDIEKKKIRADFGITYDSDVLKMIDELAERNIRPTAVVITRYQEQDSARIFRNKLERRGVQVFTSSFTKGYPTDVETIVSEKGYGANPFIPTEKPIVAVTGPGPGSGKLATCLSQLYHEHRRGVSAGFAKFETFPIWNLELDHPVNTAYEAATAELRDCNMLDHFHLAAHNIRAVNYNRDIEAFPLLRRILEKITRGPIQYQSPTDMGVNQAACGIIDDQSVRRAAGQEIIRRYFRYKCEFAMGFVEKETVERLDLLMKNLELKPEDRPVVPAARLAAEQARAGGKGNEGIYCGAALELPEGLILSGKNSPLFHAASSLILNALKHLARIPDEIHLLPPLIIDSLFHLKKEILCGREISLDLNETLTALGISAQMNPLAQAALEKVKELRNCEAHLTHMPTPGDEAGLRKLGINLTSDPDFSSKSLFIN